MSIPIVCRHLIFEAQFSHSHRFVIYRGLVLHLVIVSKLLQKELRSEEFLILRQVVLIWRDVPFFMPLASLLLLSNDALSLGRTLLLAFDHLVGNGGLLELSVRSLLMFVTSRILLQDLQFVALKLHLFEHSRLTGHRHARRVLF